MEEQADNYIGTPGLDLCTCPLVYLSIY